MLSVKKLIASALECLGWPYVSPGTNDKNGIDCSGLWVKCFKDQGSSIYHGSNTIYRNWCSETGKLTSESQLQPGMAVFKGRAWTESDSGNRWYQKTPGNLYHIGMVTNVNPLVITHATSPVVKQDKTLGKWNYWGKVKEVDYSSSDSVDSSQDPEPTPAAKTMYVYADNGKPVNMRTKPNKQAALVERVPVGASVSWQNTDSTGWAYIKYQGKNGWMMDCYLQETAPVSSEPVPESSSDDFVTGESIQAEFLTVWANNGKTVKLRARPSSNCSLYDDVPIGANVELVEYGEDWCKVNYKKRKGWYIMTRFLGVG